MTDEVGASFNRPQKSPAATGLVQGSKLMRSLFSNLSPSKPDSTSIHTVVASLLSRSDSGIVRIAPGIAQRILDEANFQGQRRIKPERRNAHLRHLVSGTWMPSFPITFARLPDGTLILLDGQHRLSAIVEYDTVVSVRVNVNDAATLAIAQKMYAGFDTNESVRTELEVLDGIGITGAAKLPRRSVGYVFRALSLLNNNLEPMRGAAAREGNSLESRIAISGDWMEIARTWHDIAQSADSYIRGKLWNAGSTAVGMYTLKHQPTRAIKFWQGLADNNGLGKYDPRARLIADFQSRSLNAGSARQSVQAPAIAWNAWNEERELRIIKCIDGAAITLWGTPFSKGNT